MADTERIPIEARWRIATRSVSALTMGYEMALETALGEQYAGIVERVWRERGADAGVYASAFGMPVRNAREIAEALRAISRVVYGPEFETRLMRSSDDVAVVYTLECPLLNCTREMGGEPERACTSCRAFASAAVEGMNPAYALQFRSGMCLGEDHCQMNIARRSA